MTTTYGRGKPAHQLSAVSAKIGAKTRWQNPRPDTRARKVTRR
jgi:hypothetical protein